MNRKALITSLSGYYLTKKEIFLLREYKPWGIILFKRNIKNYKQIKRLIKKIRYEVSDNKYPILIDEEGGTVSRLKDIIDNYQFSQRFFGKMQDNNNVINSSLYEIYLNKMCFILKDIGININTVPVLDKYYKGTNKFLSNRVYSSKIKTIKDLGNKCVDVYNKNKISTVIKHIPGHGLSKVDSHKKLPIVNKNIKYLKNNDFACFKNSKSKFAMTAHILFKKIDKKNCVTHSKVIIDKIIRKEIKFKGIIISDDIGMKSLKFSLVENGIRSLKAGCNLVLYCGGKYNESLKLLKKLPIIDKFTKKKTSEFYRFLR